MHPAHNSRHKALFHQQCQHTGNIQTGGVVRVVVDRFHYLRITLLNKFTVIKTRISGRSHGKNRSGLLQTLSFHGLGTSTVRPGKVVNSSG